jgi:threonine dehydratase
MNKVVFKTKYKQLNEIGRPDIYLKLECDQFSNSFKIRGIEKYLSQYDKIKGLITYTTGNHGVAVAAMASSLNIPAIVLSSQQLTEYKRSLIEQFGAEINILSKSSLNDATTKGRKLALDLDYIFVPLYDDVNLLNGYSEIAEEIDTDFEDEIILFVPIGSGSLLLANSIRLKQFNSKNKIVGVEPHIFQRISKKNFGNLSSTSIADSLSIESIPDCNLKIFDYTDEFVSITEEHIKETIILLKREYGIIVEGGGVISLCAALKTKKSNINKIALITGKNISADKVKSLEKNSTTL